MRIITVLCLAVLSCSSAAGQHKAVPVSDSVIVTASGRKAATITLAQLQSLPGTAISDVVIRNHTGIPKDTLTSLRGVLLKDLLQVDSLLTTSPKLWSAYYVVCIATDGYKVVFSWNELFNSPTGANTWLITSKNGAAISGMHDRIVLLCTSDINTGRRFVKGLQEIRFISVL